MPKNKKNYKKDNLVIYAALHPINLHSNKIKSNKVMQHTW